MSIRMPLVCGLAFVVVATLAACTRVQSVEPEAKPAMSVSTPEMTPVPNPSPTATALPTTAETATSEPVTMVTPTPTSIPKPSPTPTPEPRSVRSVTEDECCGLFTWLDADRLLVFDQPEDEPAGSRVVDLIGDQREYFSPGFGMVQRGVYALIEPGEDDLVVRNDSGDIISRIPTGGAPGWPSPDGSSIAWLEPLPVRTPSSSVHRSVQLNVVDIGSGASRRVLDLQASELMWLPDSTHLIAAARNTDFGEPGLWKINILTGEYQVVHDETFLRSVRLAPDGRFAAFMRLFNEDPTENGLWVLDFDTWDRTKVFESGSFQWDASSRHIWRLEMTPTGSGKDSLERFDIFTGEIVEVVELDGQILNEMWSISPNGSRVAYWRVEDGLVVVEELR